MTSMREICRLCMCRDDSMVSIFDEEAIAAKITWVSQLKIFQGDPLPAQICKQCSLRLDSAYYFKEQCISIDRALREMVQHQCSSTLQEVKPPTSDPAAPVEYVEDHIHSGHNHLQTEHFDSSFNSQDSKPEAFEHLAIAEEDATLTNNNDMPPKYETNNDSLGVMTQADPAPEAFSDRNTRLSHVPITKANKGFPCPICNKTFRSNAHLKRHIPIHSKIKTAKREKNFEKLTRLTDNDIIQPTLQVDVTPNLYKEVDIKHEHLDIATETTSDIRGPGEATFQSPDFNGRGERSYRPPDIGGPGEATFQSPDFNGRGERSHRPPDIRGPGEATFQSPDFNGRGERSYRPPDIGGPGEATFQSPDFNGRGERSYRPPDIRGPGEATFQSPDFRGERSYRPPDIRGPGEATFQSPDFRGERSYRPPGIRGPGEGTLQSPEFNGREERFYQFSNRGPGVISFQPSDFMGRGGGSYCPPDISRSRAGQCPDFNRRGERFYRPSDRAPVVVPSDLPYHRPNINRSRAGLPMGTFRSYDFNRHNVGPPTATFRPTDHNRPSAGFPMLTTQRFHVNRPNVLIPMGNLRSSDFNRPNVGIPAEAAQSSDFNRPNVGTVSMQRTSDFNRPNVGIPAEAAQSSDFNRPNVGTVSMQRTSDFNRPNVGIPAEAGQSSDFNRPNVGTVSMQRTRPSDFNSSSHRIPVIAQSSNFNGPNVELPNLRSSALDQPDDGVHTEAAQSDINGPNVDIPAGNLRSSDLNRPDHGAHMEDAQCSDVNRRNVGIPVETTRPDVNRRKVGTPVETTRPDMNRRNVGIPSKTTRPDVNRRKVGTSVETTRDPTSGSEDESASARRAKKRRARGGTGLMFKCPFCDQKFRAKSRAEGHILGHLQSESDDGPPLRLDEFEPIALTPVATRVDAFVCDICGKRVRHRGALVSHMRIHERDKRPSR